MRRALLPLGAGCAAALVLASCAALSTDLGDLVSAALQASLNGMVAVLAWRAARRSAVGRIRTAWYFLAASSLMALLVLASLVALLQSGYALPGDGDLLPIVLSVNVLAFAGLVLLSPPEVAGMGAVRFALDGLIAGLSILFLLLAFVASWRPEAQAGSLLTLAYPAVDAASLTVLLLVTVRRRDLPPWYALLSTAFILVLVTDAWFAIQPGVPTAVVDGGYFIQLGFIGAAARLARPWAASARSEPLAAQAAAYVPFGLAMVAAVAVRLSPGGLPASLFALLMVDVALMLARTGLLLRENHRLAHRLGESDAFKTQLLQFISHEVANPLSTLKIQAARLRGAGQERGWVAVDRSIARLDALSRDVRAMALAQTQRLVRQRAPDDLAAHVAQACEALQASAAQAKVELTCSAPTQPVLAMLDGDRFDQVVDNLLSNALKFTPPGGHVEARVVATPQGATLEVRDDGAGLDEGQQARLFTAFGRVHGDLHPGLGLGLYLCKLIVDGHGGRLTATSAGPGRGSTFRVDLPMAAAPV